MHEWDSVEREHGERMDLDSRLAAYYGPQLPEQPLPESVWPQVRTQLRPQRPSRRFRLRPMGMRRRSTPPYIKSAFSRIVDEAHMPWKPSLLHCSFNARIRVPEVRVSTLGRHNIKLVLPTDALRSTEQAELDVLLATGLARYFYIRRPVYMLLSLFLIGIVLLTCSTFIILTIFWPRAYVLTALPIAILLWIVMLGLLDFQRRKLAFRADDLMVQWMGRSRACQGLHILAGRSRRHRKRWLGEPTLDERIDRVCGKQVEVEDEWLTLVR